MPENWQKAGFGLYIHWPFCAAKCPYCDFNSHVVKEIDQDRWLKAYVSEIRRTGAETRNRVLTSVFFGGGTPSLMQPRVVDAILAAVRDTWIMANDIEITLEANPTSVEASRFVGYHDAGVNRVSLGVQALNDPDLKALGRLHSVDEAMAALDIARSVFDRVSFDLIYARQHQSLADWENELAGALELRPSHLSLYQLTIEDGTAFGDRFSRGLLAGLPNEDLGADLYQATQDICKAHGLPAYEVSNHAKFGSESRHNLIYWRSGDWIGIGPGAHGRLTTNGVRFATDTELSPLPWLLGVEKSGTGEKSRYSISPADWDIEMLMMGLRLSEGMDLTRLSNPDRLEKSIRSLSELGMVSMDRARLVVSPTGRPVLNSIIRELI